MKLHRLTFQGIGPFREQQEIDFTNLTASGLFLLEGPTGTGKSSVIDALVFALYGQVAAEAGDKARLVSHYLDGRTTPFVELVFATSAGVYRVRRTPQHERRKQRGEGTTTKHATVCLTRLAQPGDAHGEVLSTRVGEADAEIVRVVGLNRDQFIGTVVLPQGEFAAFLRADVKHREGILRRIFGTDLYRRLQERLVEESKSATRRCQEADLQVVRQITSLTAAAGYGDELPGWDGDASAVEQIEAAVAAATADLESGLAGAGDARRLAAERLAAANQTLDERSRRAKLCERRRDADERKAALDAQRPDRDAERRLLARGERAARLVDVLAAAENASAAADTAAASCREAATAVDTQWRSLDEHGLTARHAELVATAAGLAHLVECENGIGAREEALAADRARLAELDEHLASLDARLSVLPDELTEARSACEEAVQHAATRDGIAAERDALSRRLDAAVALERLRARHAEAAADALEATRAAAQSSSDLQDRRQRYYAGTAAELAGTLVDEQECPVCGATQHPAPAVPADDHVSRDEVDAADAEHQRRDADVKRRQAVLATIDSDVAACEAIVGDGTISGLQAGVADLESRLAAAESANVEVPSLRAAVSRLEKEDQDAQGARAELRAQHATVAQRIRTCADDLAADRAEVEAAREGHPSVRQRCDQLTQEAEGVHGLAVWRQKERAAREHVEQALATAVAAVARESFESMQDARSAVLADPQSTQLREALKRYDELCAVVADDLADEALVGVDPTEVIDVEGATSVVREQDAALRAAEAVCTQVQGRLDEVRMAAIRVRAAMDARVETITQTAPVIRLARLARAENRLSINLSTWVLQHRFATVVAAANDHLQRMSDGSLALEAHDGTEGRAHIGGLGLRVMDLRTDRARPTGTLSGGETFYTALSLALGLAGMVTAEAGGIDAGTLFVDEGFGSLDGTTLDDVLGVLTSLRDGGRSVGVVSHVEEMKQRIAERIEVRRGSDRGPSTLRVVA